MLMMHRVRRIFEECLSPGGRDKVARQNLAWHFHQMDNRQIITVESLQLPPLPSKRKKFGSKR